MDIVERLLSSEPLPVCPYDRRSPDYWTAPNDKPCTFCGGLNDPNAPDLCRGADTRVMGEAAREIDRLRALVMNIQALAERGFPIDPAKLATRCRLALAGSLIKGSQP